MPDHRAILFDFDGVLGMTMEDNFEAWKAVLAEYGADLAPEEYYPREGMALYQLAKALCREKGINEQHASEIVAKKEGHYMKRHVFRFYPGVESFITELALHTVPIAVVTTGHLPRLRQSVPVGFLSQFNGIVTGDQIERGKPFPDPYLKGAELVGVAPQHCIVVENSPMGIAAGKAAGSFCVGITSTLGASYLKGADVTISSFADLSGLSVIKTLFSGPLH